MNERAQYLEIKPVVTEILNEIWRIGIILRVKVKIPKGGITGAIWS